MIKPTVFCDVCGKEKKQVNHWWMMTRGHAQVSNWIGLGPWDDRWLQDTFSNGTIVAHLCGAECVQKKVSEFLGGK